MSKPLYDLSQQQPAVKNRGCFTVFLLTVVVSLTSMLAYYLCYLLSGVFLNWRYAELATGAGITGLAGMITTWFLIGELLIIFLSTDKLIPDSNQAAKQELKKVAKWKLPVAVVGIVVMLAAIPFYANQSVAFNENGLTVQGPFTAKTYEWSDVITETISWDSSTGSLDFAIRMKDGKTYSLLTDPFQMNDAFAEEYGNIYHYLVLLDAELYNRGLRNKKFEIDEGMEEYYQTNDPETWESYLKTLVAGNS